jgi:hypothetical protein
MAGNINAAIMASTSITNRTSISVSASFGCFEKRGFTESPTGLSNLNVNRFKHGGGAYRSRKPKARKEKAF